MTLITRVYIKDRVHLRSLITTTMSSSKPTIEQLKEFERSEGAFRNASLHRHFGGSKDSFGRTPIYIPSNKSSGVFGKMFGGVVKTLGRWSGNQKKEEKGYEIEHGR